MRMNYVENPPKFADSNDVAVLERVKARRGAMGLIPLDLTLLHAPPVADGWNSFLKAIRTETSLPASIRETAISRVAVLNKAWFEWDAHAPILRDANPPSELLHHILQAAPKAKIPSSIDERHQAVLEYTDAMTVDVEVPDEVFGKLKGLFSEREVTEITATVAAYNCVSRFLVALDVGERNGSQRGPEVKA